MYQYSFNNVHLIVTLGGIPLPIVNVPDQAQIFTVGRRAATKHDVMGARGEMNVASTVNLSGMLSFPLMQTAPENAALSLFQTQQEQTGITDFTGSEVISANIVDLSSALTNGNMTGGYIPGPPQLVRGNTINFLMWTMIFEKITLMQNGNLPTQDTNLTNYLGG
jgi:hypothetical protein